MGSWRNSIYVHFFFLIFFQNLGSRIKTKARNTVNHINAPSVSYQAPYNRVLHALRSVPENSATSQLRTRRVRWARTTKRKQTKMQTVPEGSTGAYASKIFIYAFTEVFAASIISQNLGFSWSAASSPPGNPERNKKSLSECRLRMRCTSTPSSCRSK